MALQSIGLPVIWAIAIVVFLVVEWIVPGLVSLWFAIGAVPALIAALLGAPMWLQVVWFIVVSVIALAVTRPLAKKYVNSKASHTNADMVIGQDCVVKETINNVEACGCAAIQGKEWTARSEDGSIIPAGSIAEVVRIEGVKLIVRSK